MYKIVCKDLTNEDCDFTIEAESAAEAKEHFYAHGAESPIHKDSYVSATAEEKAAFGKQLDEYLAAQE